MMSPYRIHRLITRTVNGGVVIAIALAFGPGVERAIAQYALGDGHVLDANPSTTSGPYNLPHDRLIIQRINEDIVTGNAPGGFGFRGDVGYGGRFDFRGSLGSDDLYQFQLDSYRSSLPLRRAATRGTPGAVAGMADPFASVNLVRPGSGANLANIAEWRYGPARRDIDPFGTPALRELRQPTIEYRIETPAQPLDAPLQTNTLAQRAPLRTASPFMADEWALRDPLSRFDRGVLDDEDAAADRLSPLYQWLLAPEEADDEEQLPAGFDPRLQPSLEPSTAPDEDGDGAATITDQLGGREAPQTTGMIAPARGQDVYVDYIADIVSATGQFELPSHGEAYSPDMLDAIRAYRRSTRESIEQSAPRSPTSTGERDEQGPDAGAAAPTGESDVRSAVSGGVVSRFASDDAETSSSHFNELMARAERALADERYFDADYGFERALDVMPAQPMALAGRVHAQLGGGLYLSATKNLRRLLNMYPELAGARFDQRIIPGAERLHTLIDDLTVMLPRDDRPDAGLLLAYTGRLADRPDLVRAGLDDWAVDRQGDPLVLFLRETWIDNSEESPER